MEGSKIRRATPDDLEALAIFIAQNNADPARECLHTPGCRARVIREALLREGGLAAGSRSMFVLATGGNVAGGAIAGASGCQCGSAGDLGWLWGPWFTSLRGWKTEGPRLMEDLLRALPSGVSRLDAFLNIENRDGLVFLHDHGFDLRTPTHIYVAPASALPADAPLPELSARHEVGFARLHRDTFPAAESTPSEELLAGRDDEHVIFAAADDLRLLGYVCVSVNAAPREGFIDYLAVRPSARGRGLGRQLLQTALRWSFEVRRLPQAALCVTQWREDARRLYERAGFRLHATGRGARRRLR